MTEFVAVRAENIGFVFFIMKMSLFPCGNRGKNKKNINKQIKTLLSKSAIGQIVIF